MSRLHCISMPTPRRCVPIPAGEWKIIYEQKMNGGYKGFIDRVTVTRGDNLLGSNDTFVDFIVDGTLKERIEREITLNFPDRFDPPLVVKKSVVFRGFNGDDESHGFEVVVDGQLCRKID